MIDNSLYLRALNNETQALMELGNKYFSGSEGEGNKEKSVVFFGKAVENALKKAEFSDTSELKIVIDFLEKKYLADDKEAIKNPGTNGMTDIFSNSEVITRNKSEIFINEGKKHFDNKSYEEAALCFEKAIKLGNTEAKDLLTEAKFNLAYMAYYGTDSNPDYEKSEKYFKDVIESKDSRFYEESMLCLAELYAIRLNKTEDAVIIWQELASKGNAEAQYNYGLALFNGMGTEQDEERGVYWWQKAAKNGHTDAKYNVEVFFSNN